MTKDIRPMERLDPRTFAIQPFGPDARIRRDEAWAQLRERCPFSRVDGLADRGFWILSRHEDVAAVLKDSTGWSTAHGTGPEYRLVAGEGALHHADPPRHTAQRKLVSKALTAKTVAAMEPEIRSTVNGLLEAVQDKGHGDLVHDFASPLPMIVMTKLLGLPPDEHGKYKQWSDAFVEITESGTSSESQTGSVLEAYLRFMSGEITARMSALDAGRDLPPGLLSDVVAAELDGRRLTFDELLDVASQLFVAGNETTTSLIANVMYRLLLEPGLYEAVDADRSLIPPAVEESLRIDAPSFANFRTNVERTSAYGVELEPDSKVMMSLGSANRDSTVWECPDEFRLDRPARTHLAFGLGPHFCLGAPLARLEARLAVEGLMDRCRGLRLVGAPVPIPLVMFTGFRSLPIVWDV
jgi:cytochrome P450